MSKGRECMGVFEGCAELIEGIWEKKENVRKSVEKETRHRGRLQAEKFMDQLLNLSQRCKGPAKFQKRQLFDDEGKSIRETGLTTQNNRWRLSLFPKRIPCHVTLACVTMGQMRGHY